MKRAVLVAAALLVVLLLLYYTPGVAPTTAPPVSPAPHSAASAPSESAVVRGRAAPPERSTLADGLNSPATDINADLRLVSGIIETFRSNFLQTGNPVGTNADITTALTGRNRLRLSLIPADHPAINKDGELCDRWGTPFFFHAESATRMEVRSAGPDKKMWSADDVVFAP